MEQKPINPINPNSTSDSSESLVYTGTTDSIPISIDSIGIPVQISDDCYVSTFNPAEPFNTMAGEPGTCSSCKKEGPLFFNYKYIKVDRFICKKCFTEKLDNIFGIKENLDLEESLYEQE